MCCRTHGVRRPWILAALVLGFLPSYLRAFLTTYWWASSSSERLESFQILQALLGLSSEAQPVIFCQFRNILLSLFFFLFYNNQIENTQIGIYKASLSRLVLRLSSSPWYIKINAPYLTAGTLCQGSTPCFLGKPCLSFPPLIQATQPIHSSLRASSAAAVVMCFS